MNLVAGERISVENLLYGLLVYSANDAAEALAKNYVGGRSEFIHLMNVKARSLGMTSTNFTNPAGFENGEHVTTAKDMTIASLYAMKNPYFAKLVSTKEITVKSTDGLFSHKLTNINKLLGEVEGLKGVKTGWTENARENLVSFVERNDHEVVVTLLGSQDRFGETEELISWIFENYSWRKVNSEAQITD
jgi:D-alanyl-D-alanine carboxypeptidase